MDDNCMILLSEQHQVDLIKKTNEYVRQFGLCLTDCDIKELMKSRRECLSKQQRVEFGQGIIDKIIFAFTVTALSSAAYTRHVAPSVNANTVLNRTAVKRRLFHFFKILFFNTMHLTTQIAYSNSFNICYTCDSTKTAT